MSITTKWIIGIVSVMVLLLVVTLFAWHWAFPTGAGGIGASMMHGWTSLGRSSMMSVGGLFPWLLFAGVLMLIVLGITQSSDEEDEIRVEE